jgi:hypothetical protein
MLHPCHTQGLNSWEQVSCYCERALNPDFWAEPINAMTNLAFILAAMIAYVDLRAKGQRSGSGSIIVLIGLLMCVGAGSFMFHTFATAWAKLADVTPIALFMAVYIVIAFVRFLNMPLGSAFAISGAVVGVTLIMFLCGKVLPEGLCTVINSSLNGSLAYVPSLIMLIIVGSVLYRCKHAATDWVLSAMCVFTVSLVMRIIDGWPNENAIGCMVREMGEQTVHIGTHSLWHILNAVTLYLLLRALIENPTAIKRA